MLYMVQCETWLIPGTCLVLINDALQVKRFGGFSLKFGCF